MWAVAAKAKVSSTLPLLSPLLCAHASAPVSAQLATSTANAALAISDTLNEVCAASELDILLVEARLDCTDAFAHVRAAVIGANGTLARAAAAGAAAGIEQFASATSSSKSLSASSSASALRRQKSNVADAASSSSTSSQAGSGPAALVRRESALTMRLSKSKFLKSNLSGRLLGGGAGNRHAIAEEDDDDDDEDGSSAPKSRGASQRIAPLAMASSKKLVPSTTAGSRANVRQGSITALLALANEADVATGGGGGIGGGGGSAGGGGGARRWAPDRPDVLKAMTDESLAAVAECHAAMMGTNGEAAGSSNLLVCWQYYDSIVPMFFLI